MQIMVSLVKDGQAVESEIVTDPGEGDIGEAGKRLMASFRKATGQPVWDCHIDVRKVDE